MECSLGVMLGCDGALEKSLNPYSNGMLTWHENHENRRNLWVRCLNPYSNGMLTWKSLSILRTSKAKHLS